MISREEQRFELPKGEPGSGWKGRGGLSAGVSRHASLISGLPCVDGPQRRALFALPAILSELCDLTGDWDREHHCRGGVSMASPMPWPEHMGCAQVDSAEKEKRFHFGLSIEGILWVTVPVGQMWFEKRILSLAENTRHLCLLICVSYVFFKW